MPSGCCTRLGSCRDCWWPASQGRCLLILRFTSNCNRNRTTAGSQRLTESFHLNLTALGLLAFVVGLFIAHAAIGLALERRRVDPQSARLWRQLEHPAVRLDAGAGSVRRPGRAGRCGQRVCAGRVVVARCGSQFARPVRRPGCRYPEPARVVVAGGGACECAGGIAGRAGQCVACSPVAIAGVGAASGLAAGAGAMVEAPGLHSGRPVAAGLGLWRAG